MHKAKKKQELAETINHNEVNLSLTVCFQHKNLHFITLYHFINNCKNHLSFFFLFV